MNTTSIGQRAETSAIEFLMAAGYRILGRNWKTRSCEIDIVAYRDRAIHFVEVKYRASSEHGLGFEYITQAKLKRMRYAAHVWVTKHNWPGEYVLSGIAVTGVSHRIEFIEQLHAGRY